MPAPHLGLPFVQKLGFFWLFASLLFVFIGVWLAHNVTAVSGVRHSDSTSPYSMSCSPQARLPSVPSRHCHNTTDRIPSALSFIPRLTRPPPEAWVSHSPSPALPISPPSFPRADISLFSAFMGLFVRLFDFVLDSTYK